MSAPPQNGNTMRHKQNSYLHDLFHEPLLWICLIVISGALIIAGCGHQPVNAPLPPGALNSFDADSYRTLADAHAAVQSLQMDVAGGKIAPDASQRAVLNTAISDVNLADHAYQLYHANGAGDTNALSESIQKIVGDLAALATAFPKTPPPAPK